MMRFMLRLTCAATLTLSFTGLGLAQTAEQREALASRVESFTRAVQTDDMDTLVKISMPPKFIEQAAAENGVTPAQEIEASVETMEMVKDPVIVVSFDVDIEGARFTALADGTLYALLPTETVFDMRRIGGGKIRSTTSTLGLLDGGTWYLPPISDPEQIMRLKQLYPAFADVELPEATTEQLQE